MKNLQLAGFAVDSQVNGPGKRFVIWAQGCTLNCPGCFNPSTHGLGQTTGFSVAEVVQAVVDARTVDTVGVTFSGGEPFQQAAGLASVARALLAVWPRASLMAFTGYRLEELRGPEAPSGSAGFLAELDLLVDGPFDPHRLGGRPWRGSRNQRFWVLGRPSAVEAQPPQSEICIGTDGQVMLSGFPDARLQRAVLRALSAVD